MNDGAWEVHECAFTSETQRIKMRAGRDDVLKFALFHFSSCGSHTIRGSFLLGT